MASSERATTSTTGTAATASSPASDAPASGTRSGSREEGFGGADKASGAAATATEAIERARVSCEMNARYHACREAHLDSLHRWLMFGVIATGAAAIFNILPAWLRDVFAGAAALFGALDLTFDLSNRARTACADEETIL